MCYDFAFLAAKNNEFGMFLKVLKENVSKKRKKMPKNLFFQNKCVLLQHETKRTYILVVA